MLKSSYRALQGLVGLFRNGIKGNDMNDEIVREVFIGMAIALTITVLLYVLGHAFYSFVAMDATLYWVTEITVKQRAALALTYIFLHFPCIGMRFDK